MTRIPEEEEPDHVFEDRSGIRGKVVVVLLAVLAVMTVVWLWDLGRRLLIDLPLNTAAAQPEGTARPPDAFITLQANAARPCERRPETVGGRQRLVLGYLPAADNTALTGLRSRCDRLDRVLADAFLLGAPNGAVVPLWAGRNRALQDLADQMGMPGGSALTVAQITASTRTDELAHLLSDGPALDRMTEELAGFLREQPLPGLCIDLTAHPDLDPRLLREALSRLSLAAGRPGQLPPALCLIAGPEAGFWRDARLVNLLDLAVVKAFRETSSPLVAPAPPDWFNVKMAEVKALVPGPKLVVALGSFGQSWQSGQARSQRISYAEALARADRADLSPRFDPARGATAIRYLDSGRRVNDIWLLDAATAANQLAGLAQDQSVAIWPLGYEDPALWSLLQPDPAGRGPAERLTGPVDLSHQVLTETGGPAVGAILPAVPGERRVAADASALRITAQDYAPLPLPNRVLRRGVQVQGGLVLAFDGLPSLGDVDGLLKTLSQSGVKAAFFADLRMLLLRGASARKLVAAGHVLGLRLLPPLPDREESRIAARMLLNFAQLYLTETFGQPARLVLLRPGAGPPHFSRDAFVAEADLLERGLIPIRSSFDAPFGPIDPDEFTDRILREGGFDQTQVVTLDLRESGPDQLAALPKLLSRLIADGFRFLAPDMAARADGTLPTAAALPEPKPGDGLAFSLANFLMNGVTVLFFVMLVISAAFSLIYIFLSLIRRRNPGIDPDFTPPVAVIIPAFNEEKVIAACVASVMRSDYPDFQVFIVDDGSTDHTFDVVRQLVADHPRLHLLREENAGKWHAANLALAHIDTPIFIAADADSIFLPDTIRWLVQPFKDARVGAVAGLVEVGNRVNLLTDFQHQEYMVTQNVLRRAHEFFDGILVVPGAVGAWRTQAVRAGGGFSGETITEDADLTVAVHRAGYRVRFEERARSITEVPVTVRAFLRQRLRWQLGMLQVSWKHRGVIPSGLPVGFSVVDSIWFGPVSLLLALLDDILLVTVVGTAVYSIVLREALPGGSLPILLFTSYFIMTGIEVLRTLTAFWFERRWEWKTLFLIPLLRFGYRQLLYITAIRGLFRAVTGHPTGWYKIDRTGTRLRAAGQRATESAD
ncbi:glycosyltransferase [Tabrizicola caldifontis]|uniref:glycosyltransferase n=1 Tax=Tabrizicola caldifontis TaxID=2528036 RepID=UPI00108086C2|nr:glycosyltransferase [Rhodobacter sp. YIM 73028]